MKGIFKVLAALLLMALSWPAMALSSRVVATVTVTNAPTTNGMTFQANADIRTWTNSTTASPSTTILTNAAIGGVTTNLWNQLVTYPYADFLLPVWKATNQLELWAPVGTALTVTITGPWASVTYTTNPVTPQTMVRSPISSEPTGTTGQRIASEIVSDLSTLSTNSFGQTATALANHVNLSQAQTVGNKTMTNAVMGGPNGKNSITNLTRLDWVAVRYGVTNNGLDFIHPDGVVRFRIRSDTNGFPSLYIVGTNTITGNNTAQDADVYTSIPGPGNLLVRGSADLRYGQLDADNAFSATSSFAAITNSLMVGSTVSNTVSKGTLEIDESFGFKETTISSLANGVNAAVPIGSASWIRLTSGPTLPFSLDGIANGGKRDVFIFNDTGQDMTVNHESGSDPVSTNRIVTMNGSTRATTGNGVVHLKYSTSKSRWVLVGIEQ